MKDKYLLHKHTSETISIETKLYFIDGIHVCLSWFGDDKHSREMCPFLWWQNFGTIPFCSLLGQTIHYKDFIVSPEDCPLKNKQLTK